MQVLLYTVVLRVVPITITLHEYDYDYKIFYDFDYDYWHVKLLDYDYDYSFKCTGNSHFIHQDKNLLFIHNLDRWGSCAKYPEPLMTFDAMMYKLNFLIWPSLIALSATDNSPVIIV